MPVSGKMREIETIGPLEESDESKKQCFNSLVNLETAYPQLNLKGFIINPELPDYVKRRDILVQLMKFEERNLKAQIRDDYKYTTELNSKARTLLSTLNASGITLADIEDQLYDYSKLMYERIKNFMIFKQKLQLRVNTLNAFIAIGQIYKEDPQTAIDMDVLAKLFVGNVNILNGILRECVYNLKDYIKSQPKIYKQILDTVPSLDTSKIDEIPQSDLDELTTNFLEALVGVEPHIDVPEGTTPKPVIEEETVQPPVPTPELQDTIFDNEATLEEEKKFREENVTEWIDFEGNIDLEEKQQPLDLVTRKLDEQEQVLETVKLQIRAVTERLLQKQYDIQQYEIDIQTADPHMKKKLLIRIERLKRNMDAESITLQKLQETEQRETALLNVLYAQKKNLVGEPIIEITSELFPVESEWKKNDWMSWLGSTLMQYSTNTLTSVIKPHVEYKLQPHEFDKVYRRIQALFLNFYQYIYRLPFNEFSNFAALLVEEKILKLVNSVVIRSNVSANIRHFELIFNIDGHIYNERKAFIIFWDTSNIEDIFYVENDVTYTEFIPHTDLLDLIDNFDYYSKSENVVLIDEYTKLFKVFAFKQQIALFRDEFMRRLQHIHNQQRLDEVNEILKYTDWPILFYNIQDHPPTFEIGYMRQKRNLYVAPYDSDFVVNFMSGPIQPRGNIETRERFVLIHAQHDVWLNTAFLNNSSVIIELFRPVSDGNATKITYSVMDPKDIPYTHPSFRHIFDQLEHNLTPFDMSMAYICAQTYEKPTDRKNTVYVSLPNTVAITLNYNAMLSTEFYAHYENDKTIVVAFQGANLLYPSLFRAAAIEYVRSKLPSFNYFKDTSFLAEASRKLTELTTIDKKIFLTGHSFGAKILAQALYTIHDSERFFETVTFAGFVPDPKDIVMIWYAQSASIRKLAFIQDQFASNVFVIPNRQSMIQFSEREKASAMGAWLELHKIGIFTKKETRKYIKHLDDSISYNFA